MKLSPEMQQNLVCPATKQKLLPNGEFLESAADPAIRYPIVDEIPILIVDDRSLFSVDDFLKKSDTTFELKENRLKSFARGLLPEISANIKSAKNYSKILETLPKRAKILVIGGSIKGDGMDPIYSNEAYEVVGTDVSFGPCTDIICDAHDIPFKDEAFDCVIVQAVLEHVLDPQRCVNEIHRVLKPSGLVYAETPFMQQVHMKQYDFTRFTHLGHRRLFRYFEEVDSGPVCGPGMALAWAYFYFLRSFASSTTMRRVLTMFAHLTSFYLKYFDYYLIDKPGSYDAASGMFFMGTKSVHPLSDKDLINQYRGVK